jgi:UDP-sulfoquinovose synthase
MKIIVLGADGYLGWPTCMYLQSRGHRIIAVDNYLKRRLEDEVDSAPLVRMPHLGERSHRFEQASGGHPIAVEEIDVTDFKALDELFAEEKPDAVVHYAEQPSGPYSMMGHKEASLTLDNNVRGTLNLVHAILNNCPDCHLVKLGTMGEYGTPNIDIEEGWIDIEHNGRSDRLLFPRAAGSLYHTTKILDTDLLWFYVRMKKLRVTDLMQGPVYGTYHEGIPEELGTHFHYDDIFGTALNRFVVQAVVGHPLTVYGTGGQTRGYLDIRDTVQCIALAAETPAAPGELRIMNQFTESFSALELAERVRAAASDANLNVAIDHIDNPRIESEDHYYSAKNSKLMDLGLEPHLLDSDTVLGMIRYVQKHRDKINELLILPRVRW